MRNILLIDNLDSFSFNLVESFERLGCEVKTVRNSIAAEEAAQLADKNDAVIVISPGPGHPESAGCCLELINVAKGKLPLVGICLGHQALVHEAGGKVCQALVPVHGKAMLVDHDGVGPFFGLAAPVRVGRYHSLGVNDPPPRFRVHAWADGMAMAISDSNALQTGLQFHPESVLTPAGDRILSNILTPLAAAAV